ncbi:PEP-CTERM sorting domain-containing protein [Methylophilus sp. OH31]|uniref:PEP-CTERM sorting domain-containing protein n=1 Tax=Methylophilus sp. OH31 TaxID=1387312 RepID=UPI0004BC59D9|nr:PEP-CTERM sorting domain-containing protein [Methylophilus sp. OH31]
MKATMLKQSFAIAAFTLAASSSAYAGGFVDLVNTGARTPGSTNNTGTDAFYLGVDLPSTWTLQATQTSTVYSPVNSAVVGSFIDSVWLDSATNSYIIGSYFQLDNNTNGITEINSIVRSGFADYTGTLSAAWVYASDVYGAAPADGYRLRDPSRSDYIASYNATTAATGAYYDADKVAIRTDVSIGEDNPNSGLYLISFSANNYSYEWVSNAVHIVQGASTNEGGRIRQDMWLSGFAVTQVPEAETYAMFMAGLGLMGAVVRRRKSA